MLLGLLLGGLLLAYLTEKLVELLLRDLNELLVILVACWRRIGTLDCERHAGVELS